MSAARWPEPFTPLHPNEPRLIYRLRYWWWLTTWTAEGGRDER